MVRIAPVRLAYNPKSLWFDAGALELSEGDAVVVLTARGTEFGHVDGNVFEATDAQISALKSPLKPVRRVASEEDKARVEELAQKNKEAMAKFRELAAEKAPDMNPVSVEFLFDGDKAVFYFESDERVDFRDLVRDLAACFHVRVDMKQIGVRDEARMVGGIGHCGQELCCRRLGGEFNPVSIRMAKEQGLSLNPQKISGLCGRLMCCLRYEYEAYKDFHGRAPKKNAKIDTPDGEGKVVDMDVPRETISIAVEDEKPVSIPLADMDTVGDSPRPNAVGKEAWAAAHASKEEDRLGASSLLTSQLTETDKLADPTEVRRVGRGKKKDSSDQKAEANQRSQRRRKQEPEPEPVQHKQRRRRSTKVGADGSTSVSTAEAAQASSGAAEERTPRRRKPASQQQNGGQQKQGGRAQGGTEQSSGGASNGGRSRRRRSSSSKGASQAAPQEGAKKQQGASAPGRNSSALRAHGQEGAKAPSGKQRAEGANAQGGKGEGSQNRRPRRRSHRGGSGNGQQGGQQNTGQQGGTE